MGATLVPQLHKAEWVGDRIVKVDHAGEHGAVCIYTTQIAMARWRAPSLLGELTEFREHERRHRGIFAAELTRRGVRRCRSYWLCAAGGLTLGLLTGLVGRRAISATTVAIETVVLRHLEAQLEELDTVDPEAVLALQTIIADERAHLDQATEHQTQDGLIERLIGIIVSRSTEFVIWQGMRL